MNINRNAFTMIELVFVIVILGILAAVAVPRMAATRGDAHIAQGRANILAIRSGILTDRQNRLFRGDNRFPLQLDGAAINTEGLSLFDNNGINNNAILGQTVISSLNAGRWIKTAAGGGSTASYNFNVDGVITRFDYNATTGTFACNRNLGTPQQQELCRNLTE